MGLFYVCGFVLICCSFILLEYHKMISRKGQKAINEGVVGKYIKKDTPPDVPSKFPFISITLLLYLIAMFITLQ